MTRLFPAATWALIAATFIIAHQVAGKATRDALFLSQFEVTDLPKAVLVAAALSILAVIVLGRLLAQYGPARVITAAFTLSAASFIVDWFAFPEFPHGIAIALYIQMAIFGAVLISGFWSVINERFDPYTAKRTIARVGAAATFGGVLGGMIVGGFTAPGELRAMLWVLALLHLSSAFAVYAIGEGKHASNATALPAEFESGVSLLRDHRYLQWMGLVMVLVAILGALLDYVLKSQAAAQLPRSALVGFFGQFYAATGVCTFLVQSLLGPRVLQRYGIGSTLAVMPAVTALLSTLTMAVPRLLTVVIMRGAQITLVNSFFRSAFELLYTPLPPFTKRPTKAIIDVASDRLGDMLGSGMLLVLLAISPHLSARVLAIVIGVLALTALLVVLQLHRGYVEQLAASLRAGAINLSDDEVVDATTRHILAETSVSSERALLMARIRQNKYARAGAEMNAAPSGASAALIPDAQRESLQLAIGDLLSGDMTRVKCCLHGGFMDTRLALFLIPLLQYDDLAEDVRMELRWMVPNIIGLMTDALSDPDIPLAARQRLPSVLEVVHSPDVVQVLTRTLDEAEFNLRYSAARALARMRTRDPYMLVDDKAIYAAAIREVSVEPAEWAGRNLRPAIDLPLDLVSTTSFDARLNFSLEHVFTLLGLVLDREALLLALHAMESKDPNLNGTALEYLENVLPDEVRRGLWPRLELVSPERPRSHVVRPPGVLAEDLKRRMQEALHLGQVTP